MIIFYNKTTGKIVGTIDGRIHREEHLKMWVGNKEETDRIIVNWKKTGKEFEPDHKQKDLFIELDKKQSDIYKYRVDLKTKELS